MTNRAMVKLRIPFDEGPDLESFSGARKSAGLARSLLESGGSIVSRVAMNISNVAAAFYTQRYHLASSGTSSVQGGAEERAASGTAAAAKTAVPAAGSASFAEAKTSEAVRSTLLLLQETGSVFDSEDTGLMNVRGVSDEDRARFAQIIQEAVDNNAYDDPVAYIQSLSAEDVEVLRTVHCLAETSGVTDVSTTEGATNLLLPPGQFVDTNNDGLVSNGMATLFQFPPPNAPRSVKDAWDSMSQDMTMEERMLAQVPFMVASIAANVRYDADGTPIGIYEPGDAEYTNIFGTTQAEWDQLLDRLTSQYAKLAERDSTQQARLDMLKEFSAIMDSGTASTVAENEGAAAADEESAAEDERVVTKIDGVDVVVSGHNLDDREGISLLRTYEGTLSYSAELYAQIFGNDSAANEGVIAADGTVLSDQPGMTLLSSTALGPLPEGATSYYMPVTHWTPEGQGGVHAISADPAEQDAFDRQRVEKYMDLVGVERQLKARYGDDVKLAYSHEDAGYIMLSPDDARYDEIAFAEDGVGDLLASVRKGEINKSAVTDVLGRYGYRV